MGKPSFPYKIVAILALFLFFSAVSLSGLNLSFTSFKSQSTLPKIADSVKANKISDKADLFFKAANYDSAIYYYLLSAQLYKNKNNWEKNINCIIQVASCYRKMFDIDNALKYVNQAENLTNVYLHRNSKVLSDVYYMKALTYLQQLENLKAIEYFNKTIVLRNALKLEKDLILSKAYSNLGTTYYYMGEYDRAIECYQKAYKFDLIFNNTKDFNIDINNIGSVFYAFGQYEKAIEYFQKAIQYNQKNGNLNLLNINYLNTGSAFNDLGKYYEALDYYKQSLYYFEKFSPTETYVKLLNNIGVSYNGLGQHTEALDYFNKSLAIATKLHIASSMAMSYNNMGVLYDDLKDYPKALFYYQQALAINKSLRYKSISGDLNNIGTAYFNANKPVEALSYYKKSLELALASSNNIEVCRIMRNIGDVYFLQTDNLKALSFYQKGLNYIVQNYSDTDIYSIPKISASYSDLPLLELLNSKASAFFEYYNKSTSNVRDLESSLINYDLSTVLIDKIRTSYTTNDTKMFFAAKEKNTYAKSIEVALHLYDKTKKPKYQNSAFEFAEKGKVTLLYELIRDNEAKKYAGIPDSILASEKELKNRISYYKKAIYDEKLNQIPAEEKVILWEKKVFSLSEQLDQLTSNLEKNYPKYFEFKYDNKIFSPADVQKYLSPDDVLLEYFIGENSLYTFFITKNDFKIKQQNIDSGFIKLIDQLRNCLLKPDLSSKATGRYNEFISVSYALYKILIAPFANYLGNKHLVIVPDGALGYIPFEALISKPGVPGQIAYRNLSYLVKEHAISYGYSSTLLISSSKIKHKKASLNLSAFAPFFNKKFKTKEKLLAGIYNKWKEYDALPGTKKEVEQIGKIANGKVFLDSFATEARFKEIAHKYRILHVATHGVIDDKNPMYSKLIFYMNKDSREDGFLYTYELFNMELSADLAVLSACNTGDGKLQQGEGIMTIARGFLYAGVPSIVMSLWSVNDESSSSIMEGFYEYLKKGITKDEALQRAKIDYLKNADNLQSNPYYWAGFVNIGSTKPIKFNSYLNYLWYLLILVPVGLFIFYRKRRR